jgi:hypothetical protein
MRRFLVTDNIAPSSTIIVTLMMEALVSPKRWLLQDPHDVTSQKKAFFLVTAVSNITENGYV